MKVKYVLLAWMFACSTAQGQVIDSIGKSSLPYTSHDSLSHHARKLEEISDSRLFQMTYAGVPLILGGLIEKHQDTKFRSLRNDFMPEFHRPFDNYTQYIPAVVMYGMKAAGVKSRSSWGRMILSDALSAAIMAGSVQYLKHSTNITRPDGSDNHSFPSGHTATAFMTATMLSKEYGHLSPWVSVGSYALATTTGLMRVANNKHWISDVMVGAGFGIISTEMGYWLADMICNKKGLLIPPSQEQRAIYYNQRPSFLGVYLGFNVPLSHYDIDEAHEFETSTGTTLGVEGAYFFSPYIGLGGRMSISNMQYILNGNEAPENTFNFYSLYVGPYFSLPLSPRWRVGSKVLIGSVYYPANEVDNMFIQKNNGLAAGTGFSIDYQVKSRLATSLFLDYNVQAPHSTLNGEYIHLITLGARASVRF